MVKGNLVRIGIFKRSSHLSVSEFRDYWHYHHGAIAINMHGMQSYDQNHVVRNIDLGIASYNERDCAGMSKIWFGNMENVLANDPTTMHRLALDEKYLFEAMDLVLCEELEFKSCTLDVPYVKFICLLRRKNHLSVKEFNRALSDIAYTITSASAVKGYIQNNIINRTYNDIAKEQRIDVGYDAIPIDSILEFYLEYNEENIQGSFLQNSDMALVRDMLNIVVEDSTGYLCNVFHIK